MYESLFGERSQGGKADATHDNVEREKSIVMGGTLTLLSSSTLHLLYFSLPIL